MYSTMICAEIRFGWDYVATRVAYIDRFRGMDTSGLPDSMEFRCIIINFPRIYLLSLAAYSRASGVHYDLRGNLLRRGLCGNAGCLF